jgi:hypothetical protein
MNECETNENQGLSSRAGWRFLGCEDGRTAMNRSKLNLIIDGLMFLAMAAIAGLGFLIKYVMPPGPEKIMKYGRNVTLLFLGMDRHGWGAIHLAIAFIFLGLLALHIILHWRVTVNMSRKLITGKAGRAIAAVAFVVISLFLVSFSLLVKPVVEEGGHGSRHRMEERWDTSHQYDGSYRSAGGDVRNESLSGRRRPRRRAWRYQSW